MQIRDVPGLKPGDRLLVPYGMRWRKVEVLDVTRGAGGEVLSVRCRREGVNAHTGNPRFPPVRRLGTCEVAFPAMMCGKLTANIYADWLDDQGEHQAAAKLRAAFPLGEG